MQDCMQVISLKKKMKKMEYEIKPVYNLAFYHNLCAKSIKARINDLLRIDLIRLWIIKSALVNVDFSSGLMYGGISVY